MNPNPTVAFAAARSLHWNRRRFLQTSALVVAAAPHYGALVIPGARAQSVPASEKLRLGFIGVDGMGLGDLASFFMNPEVECPVVCDVDDKRIGDARPAHVRNFLDCVKSRQPPATNLEVGHFVTSIAHLGNIAYRTGEKIAWDPIHERIPGGRKADALVGTEYRKPWKLPYTRRG